MTAYVEPTANSKTATTTTTPVAEGQAPPSVKDYPKVDPATYKFEIAKRVAQRGVLSFVLTVGIVNQLVSVLPASAQDSEPFCAKRTDKRLLVKGLALDICLTSTRAGDPRVDLRNLTGKTASIVNFGRGTAVMSGDAIRFTGTSAERNTIYGKPSDVNVIAGVSKITQSALGLKAVTDHLYGGLR